MNNLNENAFLKAFSFKRKAILFGLLALAITANAQTVIKSNDAHIHYMGRVIIKDDNTQLQW